MRRKTRAKIALSDYKIAKWFEENPQVFQPVRDAYCAYFESITLVYTEVTRESYGGTRVNYRLSGTQSPRQNYGSVDIPLDPKWIILLDNEMEAADRVMSRVLPQVFGSGMPTHNRNWENWYKAVWDNPADFPSWGWISDVRHQTRERLTHQIRSYVAQESTRARAFNVEKSRALTRLISLQKEYKYLPADFWHELVDIAIMHSIHSGNSPE